MEEKEKNEFFNTWSSEGYLLTRLYLLYYYYVISKR
jgi:hypothetical protein